MAWKSESREKYSSPWCFQHRSGFPAMVSQVGGPHTGLLALGGTGGGWRDHLSESELLAASVISCLSSASVNKDAAIL